MDTDQTFEAVLLEARVRPNRSNPFGPQPEVILTMTFPPGELEKLREILNG